MKLCLSVQRAARNPLSLADCPLHSTLKLSVAASLPIPENEQINSHGGRKAKKQHAFACMARRSLAATLEIASGK